MANPFDQFDQAQPQQGNVFDQFEANSQNESGGFLKNAGGVAAGVGDIVGGIPGFLAGLGTGVATAVGHQDPTGGLELGKEVMAKSTPTALLGVDMSGNKGYQYTMKPLEWFNDVLGFSAKGYGEIAKALGVSEDKVKAVQSTAELALLAGTAGLGKGKAKGVIPEEIKSDISKNLDKMDTQEAPKPSVNTFDQFDNVPQGNAIERMRAQLGGEPPIPEVKPSAMANMADTLMSREGTAKDSLDYQRQQTAQKELEDRQTQLELDTKKQQTLDFGAAERARQEQMPVSEVAKPTTESTIGTENAWGAKDRDRTTDPSSTDLEALKADIEKNGIKKPITITVSSSDGRGYVTDGNNRLAAAKALGLDNVPYRVEKTDVPFTSDQLAKSKSIQDLGIPKEALLDKPKSAEAISANKWLEDFLADKEKPSQVPYIPPSQRGGINIKAISETYNSGKEKINDAIKMAANLRMNQEQAKSDYFNKNIPEVGAALDTKFAPPDAPNVTIQKALASGVHDTPSIWGNVQSGAGLAAAKFKNNPILLATSRAFNYATKKGEYQVRQLVHPLEKFLASMPAKELADLHEVMRREMFNEKRYSEDQLRSVGLNDKQINAYKMMRQAFDTALEVQNKARENMGLKPVTSGEAYMSSNWHGDWHTPIVDKTGKLAWYIRTTSKSEGVKAIAYLKEKFPELNITDKTKPEFRNQGNNPGASRDVMGAYHDMLDFFKDNGGVTDQIKTAMQDYLETKGYVAGAHSKHFMNKSNIRGFEGDRPWLSQSENAYAGTKSQISYLNSALRWSHMQEAMANLKEIMSNPDVIAKHPNAVEFAKLTMAKELGIDSNWTAGLENAIAKGLGLSRSSLYRTTSDLKTMTYLQILGASPGYMIATPLQAIMTAPAWHRVLTNEGFTHNVGLTGLKASADTMSGIANHMAHELGRDTQLPMTDFGRKALQYAEDAGIVSKNLFDEAGGLGQHAGLAKVQSSLGWTVGFPEKVARMGAFMSFAHHLEASGKYAGKQTELFRHAEELTDNALTSFKSFDRPMIVNKMGATGQMAYMFKSFLFNGFNQLSAFSRMAHEYATTGGKSGAISPLLTAVGMYGVMGGLTGMPFMNEMDGMWNLLKDGVAKYLPQHYKDVSGPGLKGTIMSMLPETSGFRDLAAYGVPSVATGAQLATRFNLAAIDPEKPLQGLAPIVQEGKEWAGIGNVAVHPNKDTALSAAYVNAPPLVKGLMESNIDAFKAGKSPGNQAYFKPNDLGNPQVQGYRRNAQDEAIRQMGMTSLPEARAKDAEYINNQEDMRRQEASKELLTRLMSGIKRGDQGDIQSNAKAIVELNPDTKTLDSALNERIQSLYTTPMEQRAMKMRTIQELQSYMRYRKMAK